MNRISTAAGKRVGYLALDMSELEVSGVFVLNILPGPHLNGGYRLTATADTDVRIFARKTDSGDPFTDIEASPISLLSYPESTPQSFDFRAETAAALVDVRSLALEIIVTNA